jgi:hypothetical protein
VTVKLKRIGDETINHFTTKMVVCLSVIWNVNIVGEDQNDQDSTRGLPILFRSAYNIGSSESLSAHEDDVASSPNLEDMRQKEVLPIGRSSWCKKECDLQDPKGVFFVKGHVMAIDPKEVILKDILGDDHVSLTIIYYIEDISTIMIIWK